jgi:hypothetical protein
VIEDAISDDVRRQIMALPDEKWEANPIYQNYVDSGISSDKAKQMIADMKGASYGRMGALLSAVPGAAGSAAFARLGAGATLRPLRKLQRALLPAWACAEWIPR